MTSLPMFPLGAVLLPHMPMPLRVFEPRYLAMLASVLGDEPSEFGVVLIERGQEVGGGDQRVALGTVARIVEVQSDEASVLLIVRGDRRIRVAQWLDDDPYPRAEVDELLDLEWADDDAELLVRAERTVRSALAEASEFVELPWSPTIELDDDPLQRSWQLAGIAPLGPYDQAELLGAESLTWLLEQVIERTDTALASLRFRVSAGDEGGSDAGDEDDDPSAY